MTTQTRLLRTVLAAAMSMLLVVATLALPNELASAQPDTNRSLASTALRSPTSPSLAELGLERGINLAGDFEVQPRGDWGRAITDADLEAVAAAGFDHVRIPIRWSSYTGPAPYFRIDRSFKREVDAVVNKAIELDLTVIINVHHFEELDENPRAERRRFLAIWRQVSRFYRDAPDSVVFELLNEPTGTFDDQPALWNRFARQALRVVRRANPDRPVIIGPVGYNHASRLPNLNLPNDPNLIATIHTYDPAPFTHQGAVWTSPMLPTGVTWEPDSYRVNFDFIDQSWGVDLNEGSAGVAVGFSEQYTAFAVAPAGPSRAADRLIIEADRPFAAVALCNYADGSPVEAEIAFDRNGRGQADLSACGDIDSFAIQSLEARRLNVAFERIALCRLNCTELVVTQYEALDLLLTQAAAWAERRNVPLYLGEFGTLDPIGSPTDPASREAWTRSVRTIAEDLNMGWGVFALDGEFGLYDERTRTWDPSLMDALFD